MGLLSPLLELPARALAGGVEHVAPQRASWQRLAGELGPVGSGARPVVVEGGICTDSWCYEPLRRLLASTGFDVDVNQVDRHGIATVEEDAARLRARVESASRRSLASGGDGLVSILAHSKGGVVARWYAQRMGGADLVSQLLTLGTPHHGAAPAGPLLSVAAAHLPGMPRTVRQLVPTSGEIASLNADLPGLMRRAAREGQELRVVSFAGDVDRPGLRGTDVVIGVEETRLDETLPNVHNVLHRGGGANHAAIGGMLGGLHAPTMRDVVHLLGGGAVSDVLAGARQLGGGSAVASGAGRA